MNPNFLDFEQPIADLEAKIQELRHASHGNALNIEEEIGRLREKVRAKTELIFQNLSAWQIAQLARHPLRPYTLDYLDAIADEFHELAGDRAYSDDPAIVGGLARIGGRPLVVIGHQKGRDTKQKLRRNFGMPRPEGYRKALRLMQMAARFRLPIVTLIDTPGAYPGVGAEERGQAEAIAVNLREMARLEVPIVTVVIGEGGSGGALALAVSDVVRMFENSIYSVISPEGCASILWRDGKKSPLAAEALKLTAGDLERLGVVDGVLPEPLGGAHRGPEEAAATLKAALIRDLDRLAGVSPDQLLDGRL